MCSVCQAPWPYSDIRSCCRQSLHAFTSRYDSTLLGRTFLHRRCFCISNTYLLKPLRGIFQLWVGCHVRLNTIEYTIDYSKQNGTGFRFVG